MPEHTIIRFEPMEISAKAEAGTGLHHISEQHMIPIPSDCGGKGSCGKCRVNASPPAHLSPLTENEKEHLTENQIQQGFRLACQTKVIGNISVSVPDVPPESRNAGKEDIKGTFESNFMMPHSGRKTGLGLALDIGTTTLAAWLCDLDSGDIVASASHANPQRTYGADVISRIAFADTHSSGTETMRKSLIRTLNHLTENLMDSCPENMNAAPEDIEDVCVVGNTTMQHIFAGLHPHSIGISPYTPDIRVFPDMRAADTGLHLNPDTPVHIFPVVSGFVGGDTLGATLADAPHQREGNNLMMDIGTNGEVVLSTPEGLWTTSCATGPALEGSQISCGMRAAAGAVHRVESGPEGEMHCHVLDEVSPKGICGSGIIDAVAVMREEGILRSDGRFYDRHPDVSCDEMGIGRKYSLIPAEECPSDEEIAITLKDVRQIQLAKAALSAGVRFLMRKAGVEHIDRTVLTGAFGARFDWRNAAAIGMLPPAAVKGKVLVRENLAGVGAVMALLNRKLRSKALEISRKMRFVELTAEPDFAMEFAKATAFPDSGHI